MLKLAKDSLKRIASLGRNKEQLQKSSSVMLNRPHPIESNSSVIEQKYIMKPKSQSIGKSLDYDKDKDKDKDEDKDKYYNYFKNKYTNDRRNITNEDMIDLIGYTGDLTLSIYMSNNKIIESEYPTIYIDYNQYILYIYIILELLIFNENSSNDDNIFILNPQLSNNRNIMIMITSFLYSYIEICLYVLRYYVIHSDHLNEKTKYYIFIDKIKRLLWILIFISVKINNKENEHFNHTNYMLLIEERFTNDDLKKKSNDETSNEIVISSLKVKEICATLPKKYENLKKELEELHKITTGGGNKFKSTKNKITVIYKKKQYTRVIYISERKKYVKINKTYLLLSKLQKV
jgi:hypothetical protein